MIDLQDISYVRLGTRDLAAADCYVREVLGLELAREDAGALYYRSDRRDHTLVYFDGDPGDHTLGFELRTADELDAAGALLRKAGIDVRVGAAAECDRRRVQAFLNFRDPTGNSIELVAGPDRCDSQNVPSRAPGITGFSHVGLCTTDAERDERFWTGLLGARVSDRIGTAPLLRIDEVHHKIALFPATRAGIQHINHQVGCIDDVMRAWYRFQRNGVRVVFGPGRHPSSGAVFLYFEGPDGMVYEFSTGVRHISPDEERTHQPRQFPIGNESFCMWGSVPDIEEFKA